jgi:hypothetical protein
VVYLDEAKSNSVKFLVWNQVAETAPRVGGKRTLKGYKQRAARVYSPASAAPSPSIGFSAGGAGHQQPENIKQDYLPLPSDVTYEGLFMIITDTGTQGMQLFCPSTATPSPRSLFTTAAILSLVG